METGTTIPREQITGLVLAGGRASRMGGVDKGLQGYRGMPLAMHALLRLAHQVGPSMISANRNIAAYESMGAPVWPDAMPDHPGPLAGLLAGLEQCETAFLVSVPCDAPNFPGDLVARLAGALAQQRAEIAVAAAPVDGTPQIEPVFCLLRADLVDDLRAALASGERELACWMALHRTAQVMFDDSAAFFDANTLAELASLQR